MWTPNFSKSFFKCGLSPTSHHLAEDLLTKPLLFANGHVEVPGPGLGIEVDERQVRKFTINR